MKINPFKALREKYETVCATCSEIIKICNDIKDHSNRYGPNKTSNGIHIKIPTHTYDPEIFIPPPKKKEESPIQIPLYIDLPEPMEEPEKG